jgi:uncharacterized protein (TIGR02246 family)
MRSVTCSTAAALLVGATATFWAAHGAAQQPASRPRPAAAKSETRTASDPARAADEKAIRAVADAYTKAYNAHNAKAIAGLFTADAQIVDAAGHPVQGRAAIEQVFTAAFTEYPEARTTVEIKGVRFLSPSLAVEDGNAHVTLVPGEPAEPNHYTVVHVKQDGAWLMASAHDLPGESAAPGEQLKPLEWLIGQWVDESPESLIITSYRWDENKNFILSDFSINVAGRPVMHGSQRIGWDPLAKVIRSWVFDSEGGFAEGIYSRQGDRWIVKMTGVTRDGEPASSTNVITRRGRDRLTWQSRDRTIGGEPTPDVGEVTVVRTPPKPM